MMKIKKRIEVNGYVYIYIYIYIPKDEWLVDMKAEMMAL